MLTLQVRGTDYNTSDGTCIRDYIDVTDLVDAHVKALEKAKPGKVGIYNVGTGKGSVVDYLNNSSFHPKDSTRLRGPPPKKNFFVELGFSSLETFLCIQSIWSYLRIITLWHCSTCIMVNVEESRTVIHFFWGLGGGG